MSQAVESGSKLRALQTLRDQARVKYPSSLQAISAMTVQQNKVHFSVFFAFFAVKSFWFSAPVH